MANIKKEKGDIRFLQTITEWEYVALVPIDRIKFIFITCQERWQIHIISEGNKDEEDCTWIECFPNDDEGIAKLERRLNMLKRILNAE